MTWMLTTPLSADLAGRLMLLAPSSLMRDRFTRHIRDCIHDSPSTFIPLCGETHQTGALIRLIDDNGWWASLAKEHQAVLSAYRVQSQVLYHAHLNMLREIAAAANALGIIPVAVKGLAFIGKLYDHHFERFFTGNDLLIDKTDAVILQELAIKLGYQVGRFNCKSKQTEASSENDRCNESLSYKLETLTKLVEVEIDTASLGILLSHPPPYLQIQGQKVICPVGLKIRYALDPDKRIPIHVEPSAFNVGARLLELTPYSLLAYLSYKIYVDVGISGEVQSGKSMADFLRWLVRFRADYDLPKLLNEFHAIRLCVPFMYAMHHAVSLFDYNVDLSTLQHCSCLQDQHTSLVENPFTMGDFISR